MEVCRLCLDLIAAQGEAKLLDGEARDMVQVVAPELNLDVSDDPLACGECTESLAALFEFKSRCFEHEAEVREKVGERRGELTLRDALAGEAGGGGDRLEEPGGSRPKAKDRLCRTCLAPIECESFTVLQPSEPDAYLSSMLDMCLVEVDLELTKDPVMCENCLENLQKLHHFKSSCQDVEDKIVEYCETHKVKEGDTIELHKVLESEMAMPDVEMALVKKEPDEAGTSGAKVKTEKESDGGDASQGDEDMSDADDELKQEEIDIKSEAGTSDSDKIKMKLAKHQLKQKLFKCEHCDFNTNHLSAFNRHIQVKHTKPTDFYQCESCHYTTPFKVYMKKHTKQRHMPAQKMLTCKFCDYTTRYAHYMKTHVKLKHTERTEYFSCEFCQFQTHCRKYIKEHTKYYHRDDVKLFACEFCKYTTKFKCNLKEHVHIRHAEHSEIFRCEFCEYKTPLERNIRTHTRLHHREDSEYFTCDLCEFRSTFKREVWRHMREVGHKKKKDSGFHPCPVCKFTTTRKDYLQCHVKRNHSETVIFHNCDDCGYTTKFKSSLNRHIKSRHSEKVDQS